MFSVGDRVLYNGLLKANLLKDGIEGVVLEVGSFKSGRKYYYVKWNNGSQLHHFEDTLDPAHEELCWISIWEGENA